ncbi:hypothetical protein KM043_011118 [Ampulex compressa]|nr:hypothetical protein KM043_011118 [Ampulex compressa]
MQIRFAPDGKQARPGLLVFPRRRALGGGSRRRSSVSIPSDASQTGIPVVTGRASASHGGTSDERGADIPLEEEGQVCAPFSLIRGDSERRGPPVGISARAASWDHGPGWTGR